MSNETNHPSPTESSHLPEYVGVLADPQRCAVVRILNYAGKTVSVETLADQIRTLGLDGDSGATDLGTDSVQIRLVHCHLPKLADHGIIDYDHESKEASTGVAFDSAHELVQCLST